MHTERTPEEPTPDVNADEAAARYWRTRAYLAYAGFALWALLMLAGAGDVPPPGDPLL
ncbi:hypothetical protein Ppa06_37580 [Planomonospora parontospora subsp. parontospora]|uniref:Uncharacterized protein n=2 Tax=Planomonospora parontospora TaxID=58119 RepID=A0AA37F5S6_9ACTN|nr:hypothetical protein [Planomonospora parontospora]GGK77692.1 hypothetical protein GCM10010126_41320 [Planomonospora parontospora]GII09960.1 hypothetical protein Ppa06_37580 [Planomonospora parontospora subsp. parontospora]